MSSLNRHNDITSIAMNIRSLFLTSIAFEVLLISFFRHKTFMHIAMVMVMVMLTMTMCLWLYIKHTFRGRRTLDTQRQHRREMVI